jgi:hypothetical protein
MLLAAAHPIVIKVPEASNGVSLESILVFAGGLLAATAAVIAALVTSRSASRRMERQLSYERQRFEKQLMCEREAVKKQFEHERYLARRSDASASIEQIARLVARNIASLSGVLDELREVTNVVVLRFGGGPLVTNLLEVLTKLHATLPAEDELPLSAERRAEVQEARDAVGAANAEFMAAARKAIEEY